MLRLKESLILTQSSIFLNYPLYRHRSNLVYTSDVGCGEERTASMVLNIRVLNVHL